MPDAPPLVKCLVWDLDNTLWTGTLLEDPDVAVPAATRDVIAQLDSRGILQSIASRNDFDLAWPRLEALGLAEYFVHPQIGWGRKSDSVSEIAGRAELRARHRRLRRRPAERARRGRLRGYRTFAATRPTRPPR